MKLADLGFMEYKPQVFSRCHRNIQTSKNVQTSKKHLRNIQISEKHLDVLEMPRLHRNAQTSQRRLDIIERSRCHRDIQMSQKCPELIETSRHHGDVQNLKEIHETWSCEFCVSWEVLWGLCVKHTLEMLCVISSTIQNIGFMYHNVS